MGKNEVEIIVTAEDKASGVLKGIGGTLGGIGRVATGAALGGMALVGGAFALAGRSAIEMNSNLETSTLQFETLMGDADKAREHVEGLFDFAARTPFETGPIIEASRIMQVFGGDVLNTEENLTRIGDTAAAVGAPIEDIGFWVGRAYAAIQGGQPFGEAAQNLMQMGAVSPDVIAEMKRLADSGASADEIFGVLQTHMDGFGGAMEKQSGTWRGLMSTISDSLNMAAATALKPFFDLAKQGLQSLATWLNSPQVQAGIQNIVQGFTTLITKITQFVTGSVIPFVQQHGAALQNVLMALSVLIVATVIPAVVSLVVSLAPVILIIGVITAVIALLTAVIALLRTAWEQNWGDIQGKTQAAWAFIQPILQTVIEWIGTRVQAAIEILRAFWVDVAWPAIQNAVAVAWPIIQTIFQAIWNFITLNLIPTLQALWQKWTQDVWPVIQTVTQNVWTILKEIFSEIGKWVNDNLIPWIQELYRVWVEVVWPAIQAAIEAMWKVVEPIWEAIREWAAETLPPVLEGLRGVFETVMSGIRAAIQPIKDLWDSFVGAVQSFWNWLSSHSFNFDIGQPNVPDLPGGRALSLATGPVVKTGVTGGGGVAGKMGNTTIVNIDARGAARGVDRDLRTMVEQILREQGVRADLRLRTS